MYHRFNWKEQIEYVQGWEYDLKKIKKPSRIFVGSTMELFGTWVPDESLEYIFKVVRQYPQHTFIFLTKQPERLDRWSPFPDNCWVGVSATNMIQYLQALLAFRWVETKHKWLSFEPLLGRLKFEDSGAAIFPDDLKGADINWLVIGQQTPTKQSTQPKVERIHEIVTAADKAGIPVFLKDNLRPLINITPYQLCEWAWSDKNGHDLRQELPE